MGQVEHPEVNKVGQIKVHFKGMTSRTDEVIDRTEFGTRVASIQLDYSKSGKKGPATSNR